MLIFLDILFLSLHAIIIIFNLFGWMCDRTRRANLFALLLTGLSWTALGLWYGFGYCPLTDWHWQVLHRLGHDDLPHSYVDYLFQRTAGVALGEKPARALTGCCYLLALGASLFVNVKKKKEPST